MAMQLNLPDKFGNGGVEWWVVVETNINWLTETAHVTLAGWVNERAYLDGKQPIDSKSYDYTAENFPFKIVELDKPDVNTLSVAYDAIKNPKSEYEPSEFSASIKV